MIQLPAETLRMLTYIADCGDDGAWVKSLKEQFGVVEAGDRIKTLREAKLIEVCSSHYDDPNDGMVIRIMPIPDSYCVTTAGRDLLSQVQKVCDERADETAKQAQKELREDEYRKRDVRRSWVQWTLGHLFQLLIAIVGALVGWVFGGVMEAKTGFFDKVLAFFGF